MRKTTITLLFAFVAGSAFAQENSGNADAVPFFENTASIFDVVTKNATAAARQLEILAAQLDQFPGEAAHFFDRLGQSGFNAGSMLTLACLYLGIGLLAEWAFRAVTNRVYTARDETQGVTWARRMAWLGINTTGLAIFALVGGWPLLMSVQASPVAQTVVVTYLAAIIGVRIFAIMLRFILAPFTPDLRLVRLADPDARKLYRNALLIGAAAICFMVTATLFQAGDMERGAILIFVLLTRSAVSVALILAFFASRDAVASLLREGSDGRRRGGAWRSFASVWPYLASLYVSLSWFGTSVLLLLGRLEANTLAVISFCAICLLVLLALGLDEWAANSDSKSQTRIEYPELPSYAKFFAGLGRALATTLTLLFLVRLWSGPWAGLVNEKVAGIVPALTQLAATFFIAFVVWQLVVISSERMLRMNGVGADSTDTMRQTRVSTLLPLIRNVTLIAIAVITSMIVLSAIGVDVLPLFAGAGVIGLALGLGSQTLVKDVVSGVFFLLDDAFRVGDYVDTGAAMGTIERAGIRSLQIRHHLGALHTVPFGEIKTIANHSRDWVIFKMDFRVPFDTDTHVLRKKFKVLGQQLLEDEVNGPLFIEPLKSAGAVRMDESAMIIRASFMTRPGDQFQLRRVVYEAVRQMLREAGIDVAVREIRVRSNEDPLGAAAGIAAGSEVSLGGDDTAKCL